MKIMVFKIENGVIEDVREEREREIGRKGRRRSKKLGRKNE